MFLCIYTDVLNVHMHRNPAKHRRLSWFRYETFITFLTLGLSTRGERDTIFTMLTVRPASTHWPNQRACTPQQTTGLVQISTNCFFKIPENSSPSLPGMTSFTSPVLFPIRSFYYDICDCHILPARAWTPALNVCPYPCTKPKSSKPN